MNKTITSDEASIAVDIGGTFTDVVLEKNGIRHSTKTLTTHGAPEEGVLAGVGEVLGNSGTAAHQIRRFVHGTTLATNAIIERRGAKTALVTTQGFRDVLEMAHEHRFEQYDLFMRRPEALVPRHLRFTLGERSSAGGTSLQAPQESEIAALAAELAGQDIESVAVCFLHSFTNPAHELAVRTVLERHLPRLSISLSHQVCPEIREYERFCTTAANAYVQPLMASYLRRLEKRLVEQLGLRQPMLLMTSGGGVTDVATACRFPIRLVESGPAGGVILASEVSQQLGASRVVAFDMGGTTAKLCLIDDGQPEQSRLFEVARAYRFQKGSGIPVRIPVIELVEIGAGGGSLAAIDAMGRIAVGPESAGSEPGPVCYGRGGTQPTVTDADLQLGKLDPDRFGNGKMRLQAPHASQALDRVIGAPLGLSPMLAAFGIGEMVDEAMASAARVHAIEQGRTLDDRTLIATGGAAPLHAARLAQKLGMRRVVIPADAGVGSAVGFLRAPVAFQRACSFYQRLGILDIEATNAVLVSLAQDASAVVRGADPDAALTRRCYADARYVGQGHELVIELPDRALQSGDAQALHQLFEQAYRRHFGRTIDGNDVEFLNWTVVITAERRADAAAQHAPPSPQTFQAVAKGQRVLFDSGLGREVPAQLYERADLLPGATFDGPALISEAQTTTVVPAGFRVTVDTHANLILSSEGQS
ncbi:hydantoinase/oxoprolinase family protein [Variovorax sp. M-6]|uniref:hydantoinase/oxoprolinase family protein n=1 Tax=Variovorax sp. M-6 TaxID=3233041 RepID=UPI003F9B2E16